MGQSEKALGIVIVIFGIFIATGVADNNLRNKNVKVPHPTSYRSY